MNIEVAGQQMLDMSTDTSKIAAYRALLQQTQALFEGEHDFIANLAQFAALIFNSVPELNWAGFYLANGEELVLGPFQGKVACTRIPFARGVCGRAARTGETQRVDDVHAVADHIACDAASQSELVIPLFKDGAMLGVFDLDSPLLARFDRHDQEGFERLVVALLDATMMYQPAN